MNIKALFETKDQLRMAEMEVEQLKDILALTAAVPGATLRERIINLLPPAPVLQPKTPPAPMQTIEAAAGDEYELYGCDFLPPDGIPVRGMTILEDGCLKQFAPQAGTVVPLFVKVS